MATKCTTNSDILKKNLPVHDKVEENVAETELVNKIGKLKEAIPISQLELRNRIDDIVQTVKCIFERNYEDRKQKEEEIERLNLRVRKLEEQLKKIQGNVDTIDAGEAIRCMENHIATFVLPPNENIADIDPFGQMLEHEDRRAIKTWNFLQSQCCMKWTGNHYTTKEKLIRYRNIEAHHQKFDLVHLREAMVKGMPHRKKECEDLVNLFEKVDILLKFGTLASELVKRHDETVTKYSKPCVNLLLTIERECYRKVQYKLQDITIDEGKKHLAEYITKSPPKNGTIWDGIINLIRSENGPRVANLVKQKEMEIVSTILQNPAISTFDKMDTFLEKSDISRREVQEWDELTGGKKWSGKHNTAMADLKKLFLHTQSNRIDDVPIHIAELHIPDFLPKDLWNVGSDIFEIFERWEKKKTKYY